MPDLKPCGMCDHIPSILFGYSLGCMTYRLRCGCCYNGTNWYYTPKEAIKAWNDMMEVESDA